MESRKIKRFINCYVATEACNFKCKYCYIGQKKDFSHHLFSCEYSLEHMKKATSIERLGGMCIFNLCAGGETLLSLEIVPVIKMLLENGHNVSIVTNGTISKGIDKTLELGTELLTNLYIKFSFHYHELKRTNNMKTFFENVHKVQMGHIAFSIDITPSDDLIEHIPEIMSVFDDEMCGAMPHISVARDVTTNELRILTNLTREEYIATWSVFESPKFDYKISEFLKPHREYCYAGNNAFSLELKTGNCRICDGAPNPKEMNFYNLYENVEEPIPFIEIGNNCPTAHCYNCHALLTLGVIPEINTPSYAEMLDRVDREGKHWLTPYIYELYSRRLDIKSNV